MKAPGSFVLSCLLALAISQHVVIATNHPRQLIGPPTSPSVSSPTPSTPSTTTGTTPTSTPPSSQTTDTSTGSSTTTTTSSTTQTTSSTSSTSTSPSNSPSSTPTNSPTSANTDATTITQSITGTASSSSDTSTATSAHASASPSSSSGLSVGSIIGMSVAGGIAVIGIIAFFIWKFSRKRFGEFDDNEAIKWPELNTHSGGGIDSHPLPLRDTGRSGFDTGSEVSLSRAASTSNYSTPDIGGVSHDPYAVPPLPHLNPNQPYRDDPGQPGYYDPYRGPVPNTLEHGVEWSGEAIPMTQMAAANTGRMSPAQNPYGAGRVSPGPQMAYDRSLSGPHTAYGAGRMSPGPQMGYGQR